LIGLGFLGELLGESLKREQFVKNKCGAVTGGAT